MALTQEEKPQKNEKTKGDLFYEEYEKARTDIIKTAELKGIDEPTRVLILLEMEYIQETIVERIGDLDTGMKFLKNLDERMKKVDKKDFEEYLREITNTIWKIGEVKSEKKRKEYMKGFNHMVKKAGTVEELKEFEKGIGGKF